MLNETTYHYVHESFEETLHTFHERDIKLIMNVKNRLFESDSLELPKNDYFTFCEYLSKRFNVYAPGKLIKQYGFINVIKAAEISLEQNSYRDKSRQPVSSLGGFFMGTLKNLSRA